MTFSPNQNLKNNTIKLHPVLLVTNEENDAMLAQLGRGGGN